MNQPSSAVMAAILEILLEGSLFDSGIKGVLNFKQSRLLDPQRLWVPAQKNSPWEGVEISATRIEITSSDTAMIRIYHKGRSGWDWDNSSGNFTASGTVLHTGRFAEVSSYKFKDQVLAVFNSIHEALRKTPR